MNIMREENEDIIKNQLELLALKSIVYEMRNSLDEINSRLECRRKDQWIWRHNNRNYPICNREWKEPEDKRASENCGTISTN